MNRPSLLKYAWLSIIAAVVTIGLKMGAWWLTGSVGFLSDAAESVVNLVAAVVALAALSIAARPADHNHHFGHGKAEYFSAVVEGVMIFLAAILIILAAVDRFQNPAELSGLGAGIVVSVIASVVNGAVAFVLLRAGYQHRSITLQADGKHLLTDVWTSAGVIVGIALVWMTGWDWLDPVIAIGVAINILWTGWKLVKESTEGLMDIAMPADDIARIERVLDSFTSEEIAFHAIRTRESGAKQFVEFHMLVPGEWSVQEAHTQMDYVIEAIKTEFPDMWLNPHLEPIEDPRSYADVEIC